MISGKKQIGLLVWLSSLYFIGVLIFTKGFLLKRTVVEKNSSCEADFTLSTDDHDEEGCWMHKRFKKAVIIIIDALKYEFLEFDHSYKATDKVPHFKNKLPFIENLLQKSPKNAILTKFIADPPTTTLQRLKGLTTGSLPTFVDAGSNFASTEITEDNVIDQMVKAGRRLKFMGDDTWLGLFPGRFKKQFPFPSFNVKDLHTVDNGILENLLPELKMKDWDILIAHFLGVDHCGHRFGPNHPAMSDKLLQMNSMIRNVSKVLDKDTVLMVLGDHGMTRTGDHGGDSADELEAGLFIYSPETLTATLPKMKKREVAQTDLVPTISLLLGLPIPYSSLGMIIPELFNHCPWSKTASSDIRQIYHTVKALRLNAHQVREFLRSYYEISPEFPHQKYSELEALIEHAEGDLQQLLTAMVTEGESDNVYNRLNILKDHYETFIQEARNMCQKIWAKFDLVAISLGLIVVFLCILINVYFYLAHQNEEDLSPISLAAIFASTVVILYAFLQAFYIGDFINPFMVYLFSGVMIVTFSIMIKKNLSVWKRSKRDKNTLNLPSFENFFATCLMFVYAFGYFSNSYVVFEDSVTAFLSVSLIWLFGIKAIIVNNNITKESKNDLSIRQVVKNRKQKFDILEKVTQPNSIIILVLLICSTMFRLLSNFTVCREEQMPCNDTIFLQPLANFTQEEFKLKNLRYFFSIGCLAAFVYLSRKWMKHFGNLNGESPVVMCAKYLIPFAATCVGLHWAVIALPPAVLDALPGWQQVLMAQLAYVSIISLIICVIVSPLSLYLVYVKNNRNVTLPSVDGPQFIPQVFRQLKDNLNSNSKEKPPMIYGLGTVYSSSLIYLITVIGVLLSLLLGDGLSPVLILTALTFLCFLEIYSAAFTDEDSEVSWPAVVTIGMITSHVFYCTGHQATISSLQWNAAFTGFYGNFNNNVLPAILMTLNTFSAQIFLGVMMPLLVFWPKLYTKLTLMMKKKSQDRNERWQGDFVFYDDGEKLRQIFYRLCLAIFIFTSIKLFGSMGAAALHRRHLMVWKIFAPRFVFEAAGSFIMYIISIVMYMFVMRIDDCLSRFLKAL
ncbi:hypothetical protein LOTGIDRAFT_186398, partial [Lottia gigantea]